MNFQQILSIISMIADILSCLVVFSIFQEIKNIISRKNVLISFYHLKGNEFKIRIVNCTEKDFSVLSISLKHNKKYIKAQNPKSILGNLMVWEDLPPTYLKSHQSIDILFKFPVPSPIDISKMLKIKIQTTRRNIRYNVKVEE